MSHSIYDAPNQFHWFFSWNITQLLTRQWYRLISKPIWGPNILALTWKKWILPTDDFTIQWGLAYGNYVQQKPVFVHVPTNRYLGSRQFSNNIRESWWFFAMGTPDIFLWKHMFQLNVPSLLKWEQKSCASAHVAGKNHLWKNLISFTVQWSTCSSCSQRNKHNLSPLQATIVDCMSYVITHMYMCDCVGATYSVVASQHTKYVPVAFWIHVHPSKYIFTHHKPRKKLGPQKKTKFDSNSELGEFWGLWLFWDFCQCFINQQPELGGPASLVSP